MKRLMNLSAIKCFLSGMLICLLNVSLSQNVTYTKGQVFKLKKNHELEYLGLNEQYIIYGLKDKLYYNTGIIEVLKIERKTLNVVDKLKINFIGIWDKLQKFKIYEDKLLIFVNKHRYKANNSIAKTIVECREYNLNESFAEKTIKELLVYEEEDAPEINIYDSFFIIRTIKEMIKLDYKYNPKSEIKKVDKINTSNNLYEKKELEFKQIAMIADYSNYSIRLKVPNQHNFFYPIIPVNLVSINTGIN